MTTPHGVFTRMVLDLQRSAHDPLIMNLAIELAELLGLDLLGQFVDPGLSLLADLPFAREFRVLEREWRSIDKVDAGHVTEMAIETARRQFTQASRRTRVSCTFEVVSKAIDRGPVSEHRAETIAILRHRQKGAAPFAFDLEAAFHAAAGVLIVPERVRHRTGPILVIAASEDVATVAVADRLAASAGTSRVRMDWPSGNLSMHTAKGEAPIGTANTAERLIVVRRGLFEDLSLPSIATRHGVPLLALGTSNGLDASMSAPKASGK